MRSAGASCPSRARSSAASRPSRERPSRARPKPPSRRRSRRSVYGVAGLLERLGVRRGARCEIDWTDVVALRGDRLIVRDAARRSPGDAMARRCAAARCPRARRRRAGGRGLRGAAHADPVDARAARHARGASRRRRAARRAAGSRYVGQWIVGTSLGLYFTPFVVRHVVDLWPLLVAAALFAIVARLRERRHARAPRAASTRRRRIFASVPGGAAEMSIARRAFRRPHGPVAAAQSLRILIVVVIVPDAIAWSGVHGADPYVQGIAKTFDPRGFALLLARTFVGSFACQRMRMPNAFVLGSLAVAIPLTAMTIDLSAVPRRAVGRRAVLLGCVARRRASSRISCAARIASSAPWSSRSLLSIALSAAFGVGGCDGCRASPPPIARARHRARRHGGDVPHGEGAAARRAARHRVPRHAVVVLLLLTPVIFPSAYVVSRADARRATRPCHALIGLTARPVRVRARLYNRAPLAHATSPSRQRIASLPLDSLPP